MKKIILASVILLTVFCYKAEAQVSVNINIGRQPVWGPPGYDYVDYYYLPDVDVYYDVPRGMFVYFDLGRWNFGASLPARYGRYDLYNSYKVVINHRNPWLRNTYYRSHYASYRGRYQPVIRDTHDGRYFAGREHYDHRRPVVFNDRRGDDHNEWRGSNNRKNNNHGNIGRDNGHGNQGRNNGHDNGRRDHGNHGGHH